MITATFRPATNDTVVGTQPFRTANPATAPAYAAGATWFIQTDSLRYNNQTWVKYGLPRIAQPSEMSRIGDVQGTSLFAAAGRAAPYDVIFVPTRPGCEFQGYQMRAAIRPRG